jgi:hypothetical protein
MSKALRERRRLRHEETLAGPKIRRRSPVASAKLTAAIATVIAVVAVPWLVHIGMRVAAR